MRVGEGKLLVTVFFLHISCAIWQLYAFIQIRRHFQRSFICNSRFRHRAGNFCRRYFQRSFICNSRFRRGICNFCRRFLCSSFFCLCNVIFGKLGGFSRTGNVFLDRLGYDNGAWQGILRHGICNFCSRFLCSSFFCLCNVNFGKLGGFSRTDNGFLYRLGYDDGAEQGILRHGLTLAFCCIDSREESELVCFDCFFCISLLGTYFDLWCSLNLGFSLNGLRHSTVGYGEIVGLYRLFSGREQLTEPFSESADPTEEVNMLPPLSIALVFRSFAIPSFVNSLRYTKDSEPYFPNQAYCSNGTGYPHEDYLSYGGFNKPSQRAEERELCAKGANIALVSHNVVVFALYIVALYAVVPFFSLVVNRSDSSNDEAAAFCRVGNYVAHLKLTVGAFKEYHRTLIEAPLQLTLHTGVGGKQGRVPEHPRWHIGIYKSLYSHVQVEDCHSQRNNAYS